MTWAYKLAKSLMMRNFISDWKEHADHIEVAVGHNLIPRGDLQVWLYENGIVKDDYTTQFRNNSYYTLITFYNKKMAFLFKMQFINEKTYKDFEENVDR